MSGSGNDIDDDGQGPVGFLGKLRDKLRPVTAKYAVNVGQETVQELQAELAKLRK